MSTQAPTRATASSTSGPTAAVRRVGSGAVQVGQWQRDDLGEGVAVDLRGAGGLVQPGAVARGAAHRGREPGDGLLLALARARSRRAAM